jgi:DNA-directed RNA polymerase subunit L
MTDFEKPHLSDFRNDGNTLKFRIENANVSIVNGLRRTILADIPIVCIHPNDINIVKNTGRINNEIIKQRISCVPVHLKDMSSRLSNYELILHKQNDKMHPIYVYTSEFKLRREGSNKYIKGIKVTTGEDTINVTVQDMFPNNRQTNGSIILSRLLPPMNGEVVDESRSGEELELTAKMSVHTAKENSSFNCASLCSYNMVVDEEKQSIEWKKYEEEHPLTADKVDWYALEGKRVVRENVFDFVVESVGVYSAKEILVKACQVLNRRISELYDKAQAGEIPVKNAKVNVVSYDIILEGHDYTIGKGIEHVIYEKYYKTNTLQFVGFKKFHPHDSFSVLRIMFSDDVDKEISYEERFISEMADSAGKSNTMEIFIDALKELGDIYESIGKTIKEGI